MIFAIFLKSSIATAQTNWNIDSVAAFIDTLTLPDTAYLHNHLIIRFRPGVLNEGALCFAYDDTLYQSKQLKDVALSDSVSLSESERSYLMAQQFPLDSNIISDPTVLAALQSAGGKYLMRLTWFNPCMDTISIARNGDTLHTDWYNLMYLYLDSGMDALASEKTLILASLLEDTGKKFTPYPDLIGKLLSTPSDPQFNDQLSLSGGDIGAETAWNYSVCSPATRVAIIDDGLDYRRCDFGSTYGKGDKVEWGYLYEYNSTDFYINSEHGTEVAGIAGALTNNETYDCVDEDGTKLDNVGVAGLAGGWNPYPWLPGNFGCTLLGYGIQLLEGTNSVTEGYAVSALLDAATWNPSNQTGGKANIINCSWGFYAIDPNFDVATGNLLQQAVDFDYASGVLVVFARGNYLVNDNGEPISNDLQDQPQESMPEQRILSVGAHERDNPTIADWSERDLGMDLIGPSSTAFTGDWVTTTQYNTDMPGGHTDGTSFAAPHATGVAALLYDWLKNQKPAINATPEDLQNILKVCAKRPLDASGVSYNPVWHNAIQHWGWGSLSAANVFQMLDPTIGGYKLASNIQANIPTADSRVTFGVWSEWQTVIFDNIGEGVVGVNSHPSGLQWAENRPVTVTISDAPGDFLNGWNIDWSKPVYVWGDGYYNIDQGVTGITEGYGPEAPYNAQIFTCIASNAIGSSDPLMPGLVVPPSHHIQLTTWQWMDLMRGDNYPPSPGITWYFSLLYHPLNTDAVKSSSVGNEGSFFCYPNPASQYTRLQGIDPESITAVTIVNSVGAVVRSDDRSDMLNSPLLIGTMDLPSGIYMIAVQTRRGTIPVRMVVQH